MKMSIRMVEGTVFTILPEDNLDFETVKGHMIAGTCITVKDKNGDMAAINGKYIIGIALYNKTEG